MAERNRSHIVLHSGTSTEPFTSPPGGGGSKSSPVPSNRVAHGVKLTQQMAAAIALAADQREAVEPIAGASVSGVYVQFESFPGFGLELDRLGSYEPELRAVANVPGADGDVQVATVFVPDGSVGRFLDRFEEYAADPDVDKPPHQPLVESIDQIRLATVRALWTDADSDFPEEHETVWWEMWLRNTDDLTDRLAAFADRTGTQLGSQRLVFDDRLIVLLHADAGTLAAAFDLLDDVAELRRPTQISQELDALPAADQAEFVDDLISRLEPLGDASARLCLLDTGIAAGHPMIAPALHIADVHVSDPNWSDADTRNHGTGMASIALYGDVAAALRSTGPIELPARLESVKILPDRGENDPKLYGAITASAVATVETQAAEAKRAFVLAVTGEHGISGQPAASGEPTLWSATVDALAAGRQVTDDETGIVYLDEPDDPATRLIIVSAGNVREPYEVDHLAHSDTSSAEEPAQAWNALVVGAMTTFDHVPTEPVFAEATPLAARGELSPFSRTSVTFDSGWRVSPDVVFEGGNAAVMPDGLMDTPPSLQVLTASEPSRGSLLTTMTGTSPAAAAGAHFHAQLQREHPDLRPETLRALMVASARWTDRMAGNLDGDTVDARLAVLRRYGWGLPDLVRAQRSATDALTLIAERSIRPYVNRKMREMHVHDLPWPTDELADLGDTEVKLRVALSYFVQPNPARRGWTGRYRYASHGLRFAVRRATESDDELRARVNKAARTEGVAHDVKDSGSWTIGPKFRHIGSLHVDEWTGSAADLAARGSIAVFPVGGWWKENPKRDQSERGVNYSLVLTIETPDVDTDIWTPVAQQVGIDVSPEVTVPVQIPT